MIPEGSHVNIRGNEAIEGAVFKPYTREQQFEEVSTDLMSFVSGKFCLEVNT